MSHPAALTDPSGSMEKEFSNRGSVLNGYRGLDSVFVFEHEVAKRRIEHRKIISFDFILSGLKRISIRGTSV